MSQNPAPPSWRFRARAALRHRRRRAPRLDRWDELQLACELEDALTSALPEPTEAQLAAREQTRQRMLEAFREQRGS